jgi:hypothetical protein
VRRRKSKRARTKRIAARRRAAKLAAALGLRRPDPRDSEQWRREYAATLRGIKSEVYASHPPSAGPDATADRSLMSRLHEEPPAVRAEIERKAARVGPVFNKGGLQFPAEFDDKKL